MNRRDKLVSAAEKILAEAVQLDDSLGISASDPTLPWQMPAAIRPVSVNVIELYILSPANSKR